jgi:hypothetical protein
VLLWHKCGTPLRRCPMCCEDGQTGDRPRPWHAKARTHRISPTSTPLPTSPGGCGAPHGAFFRRRSGSACEPPPGGLPYLALNMCRLPGRSILSMRTTGGVVVQVRSGRSDVRLRPDGYVRLRYGCCTLALGRLMLALRLFTHDGTVRLKHPLDRRFRPGQFEIKPFDKITFKRTRVDIRYIGPILNIEMHLTTFSNYSNHSFPIPRA